VADTSNKPTGHSGPARGVDRRHLFPGRTKQVFVRLSLTEYDHIAAAAARLDLTPTGYVAETALAAATGTTPSHHRPDTTGVTRAELARLQRELFAVRTAVARVGIHLDQAVAALNSIGRLPDHLPSAVTLCQEVLEAVDALVAAIDRNLR
jgi:hypothetical protein